MESLLQTFYGKEVPMYSPSSGSSPLLMKTVVFHGQPGLRGSEKFYNRDSVEYALHLYTNYTK